MNKTAFNLRPAVIAILLLGSGVSSASTITLTGSDVSFSFDDDLIELFGMPRISGNNIRFKTSKLKTVSINGIGDVSNLFNMDILVTPNEGVTLSSIGIRERGRYAIKKAGSSVDFNGQIQASDESDPLSIFATAPITTKSNFNNSERGRHNWIAKSTIDLSTSMWDDTSGFIISLDNMLGAMTGASFSKAFIGINRLGFRVNVDDNVDDSLTVSQVPIPAAAWLFGSGLIGLVAVSRRREMA